LVGSPKKILDSLLMHFYEKTMNSQSARNRCTSKQLETHPIRGCTIQTRINTGQFQKGFSIMCGWLPYSSRNQDHIGPTASSFKGSTVWLKNSIHCACKVDSPAPTSYLTGRNNTPTLGLSFNGCTWLLSPLSAEQQAATEENWTRGFMSPVAQVFGNVSQPSSLAASSFRIRSSSSLLKWAFSCRSSCKSHEGHRINNPRFFVKNGCHYVQYCPYFMRYTSYENFYSSVT